jgi:hypothetical protein
MTMTEIHAKPIIDGKFWIVESNGEKVATLHKQENNRFILTNHSGDMWFNKTEELTNYFGKDFFIKNDKVNIATTPVKECHGFPTRTMPFNAVYDVRRTMPIYTKSLHSKSFHCAGWYTVKFKNWVLAFCPKLITVERYECHGPFKSKEAASLFKCTLK